MKLFRRQWLQKGPWIEQFIEQERVSSDFAADPGALCYQLNQMMACRLIFSEETEINGPPGDGLNHPEDPFKGRFGMRG